MNRNKLTELMAEASGISKGAAERALNAALAAMTAQLQQGGHITLAGFGSFRIKHRRARIGRNPQTGTPINIASCRTVKFLLSDELKATLNSLTMSPEEQKTELPRAKSATAAGSR